MSAPDAPICPAPLSPKDLPKAPADFQAEVKKNHDLKHVKCVEKVSLPTSDDVKQEKQHSELLDKVETFEKKSLKHQSTIEKIPLPTEQDIAIEKTSAVRDELFSFSKNSLKAVTPVEKNSLPTAEMIIEEKKQG